VKFDDEGRVVDIVADPGTKDRVMGN
jgi:hypothetical protein